jgi:hypothetical protein
VPLDEIVWQDLELRLEETMLQQPPDDLTGIVRIGEPTVIDAVELARARGTELDAEVRLQLGHHDFTAVRLPLSVGPSGSALVDFLAVDIRLDAGGRPVTAWSMDPERVEDEVRVTTTMGLTGKLSVHLAEVSPTAQQSAEHLVRQPRIKAYRLGCADPIWQFTPSPSRDLDGHQLLHLVVRSPKGAAWSGTVGIRVGIQANGWPWPFRAVRRGGVDSAAVFVRYG